MPVAKTVKSSLPAFSGTIKQFEKYQDSLDANITMYWWNMGIKKLDFQGPINDFLKMKGFKIRKIQHPKDKNIQGCRIRVGLGNCTISIDCFHDPLSKMAFDAISLFLTVLGDKAEIISAGRHKRINWR